MITATSVGSTATAFAADSKTESTQDADDTTEDTAEASDEKADDSKEETIITHSYLSWKKPKYIFQTYAPLPPLIF